MFVAAPFFIAATRAGLSEVDRRYLDAAATLRSSPSRTLFRVMLPLALPSLLAGAAMTWARALGEFGATITFAGNMPGVTQTMPLAVYLALQTDLDAAVADVGADAGPVARGAARHTAGDARSPAGRPSCSISGSLVAAASSSSTSPSRPAAGATTVIVGESGAGKTSVLRVAAGLDRPDSGRVVLDGEVYADTEAGVHLPPWRRNVGYVSQDYSLFPHLTRGGERSLRPSRRGRASG